MNRAQSQKAEDSMVSHVHFATHIASADTKIERAVSGATGDQARGRTTEPAQSP